MTMDNATLTKHAEAILLALHHDARYHLEYSTPELQAILTALRAAVEEAKLDGWIVSNGSYTKWRTWKDGFSAWTEKRDEATRYARRQDAEAVHAEDEDAWHVVPYIEEDS